MAEVTVKVVDKSLAHHIISGVDLQVSHYSEYVSVRSPRDEGGSETLAMFHNPVSVQVSRELPVLG